MFEEEVVMRVLKGGNSVFADIFTEESSYVHLHFEDDRFEKIEREGEKGVGLRIVVPWKTFYACTTSFDTAEIKELAGKLKRFAEKGEAPFQIRQRAFPRYDFEIVEYPENVPLERKLSLVRRINEDIRRMDAHIRQVRIVYRDSIQRVSILTSDGRSVRDERVQSLLSIFLVGQKDGEVQTAYEAEGGFSGFELFSEERVAALVEKTVTRLKGLLSAREAERGRKTVVLASEAGGTMIHEAIGHGLEADLALEGLSCYKGMLGERVASSLVSVVDDPTLPRKRGSYAFDDEGVAAQRTVLVEEGVLRGYLFDRFHALKHGTKSTGNGRRESFRFKPIPRMSNTLILPGKDDPEKIISSVEDGILVVKMGGGEVDTVTGDFVFDIQEGYLIKGGGKGEMVKNATLMGNGPKVLKAIDMVGSDLGFGLGTCGKDGQGVPVSDAQPTLRIPELIIGGRE